MRDVMDRQKIYIPEWQNNRSFPESEQIRATLRAPGFVDLATLERPSVAVVTTLMVLMNDDVDGKSILMTNLEGVTTRVLRTAEWAKKQGVDQAPVPSTNELLTQAVQFASSYVRLLVTKLEGLAGISNGEELVTGPSAHAGLVFELAMELWNAHSLGDAKKKD